MEAIWYSKYLYTIGTLAEDTSVTKDATQWDFLAFKAWKIAKHPTTNVSTTQNTGGGTGYGIGGGTGGCTGNGTGVTMLT